MSAAMHVPSEDAHRGGIRASNAADYATVNGATILPVTPMRETFRTLAWSLP